MARTDTGSDSSAGYDELARRSQSRNEDAGSGGAGALLLILLALVLIAAPFALPAFTPIKVNAIAQIVCVVFGLLFLVAGSAVTIITKLYVRASADRAFVRTGMGGPMAVVNGGALVIPVVHKIIWVSLESMKLSVTREGPDALITADYLRAEVEATFFVHVPGDKDPVLVAAKSLGYRATNERAVEEFVLEKLISALRSVAAKTDLEVLNSDRQTFAEHVQSLVASELESNGLLLEAVTIPRLDQAHLDVERAKTNTFDARGARKAAEIIQGALVAKSLIETQAAQTITSQEVERDNRVAELDRTRAAFKAEQEAGTQKAQAAAKRDADTFAAEQDKLTGEAKAASQRQIELAGVDRERQVAVARAQREEAEQTAQVTRDQAVEVANREKEVTVAEAEKRRADAQAAQLAAENDRMAADQAVMTTEAEARATREKQVAVIGKQAETEQTFIERRMTADTAAYGVTAAATAEQEAAEKQAVARIRLAEASQKSQMLEAEGQQAVQMVPVDVDRQKVTVEQARVDVLRNELAAKDEHADIAAKLEISLAEIAAQKEVQVAVANSMGAALAGSNMQIWGDPETMAKMLRTFVTGQQVTQFTRGLTSSLPPAVTQLLGAGGAQLFAGILGKLTGQEIDPQLVQQAIDELVGEAEDIPTTSPIGIPTVRRVTAEPAKPSESSGAPSEE